MESTTNLPNTFEQQIDTAATDRRFVRIEYMTDLHEYIKTDVLVKGRVSKDGVDTLLVATGDEIPVKKIVAINGAISPGYTGYESYSCDC
ncbi:hypothetical protein [Arsenicibacter rosenii]|uniref:Uncharacterized protein n=1 Tax=Arsenicibacter rosenii TaxID=1750698 RepID=A0A1S2VNG9_9BACT|nr:hypothetical protein [Arsenicibacter rosenii]OIN60309.1 hypothetical protein BLX24_05625 [Arsenicibacter rosenii]